MKPKSHPFGWLTDVPEVGHDLPVPPERDPLNLAMSQDFLAKRASFTVSGIPTYHVSWVLTSKTWHRMCGDSPKVL